MLGLLFAIMMDGRFVLAAGDAGRTSDPCFRVCFPLGLPWETMPDAGGFFET
jgi:hypothetical protein